MEETIGNGLGGWDSSTISVVVAEEEESACLAARVLDGKVGCVTINVKAHPVCVVTDNGNRVGGSIVEEDICYDSGG